MPGLNAAGVCCDQVRSSDASWSDTRRNLRKDHRWESASLLERDEKEKLFNEHVEALSKKKKENFRQLLDETVMVRDNVWAGLTLSLQGTYVHQHSCIKCKLTAVHLCINVSPLRWYCKPACHSDRVLSCDG